MPQFSFHGSNFITISANKRGFCKAVTSCIAESFLRFWPSIQAVSIAAYRKDQETLPVFTFILREPAFGFYPKAGSRKMEVKTGKVSWLFPYAAMDMAYMEG